MVVFLLFVIAMLLWHLIDENNYTARMAEIDRNIEAIDRDIAAIDREIEAIDREEKEEEDERRHQELLGAHIETLREFTTIMKMIKKMPKADRAECEQMEQYIKMAQDGSYEAYNRVSRFIWDNEWEKYR